MGPLDATFIDFGTRRFFQLGSPTRSGTLVIEYRKKGPQISLTEDALFDVLHAVVILVEGAGGAVQFQVLDAGDAPGQRRQPVEVVARHVELRRVAVEEAQLRQLLVDDVADGLHTTRPSNVAD